MFKYIVTYIIVYSTIIPCERPKPTTDEFGRASYPLIQTSELCYKMDTVKMMKEFTNRKEAVGFIQRGSDKKNQGWPNFNEGVLDSFKLDSIKIKP